MLNWSFTVFYDLHIIHDQCVLQATLRIMIDTACNLGIIQIWCQRNISTYYSSSMFMDMNHNGQRLDFAAAAAL